MASDVVDWERRVVCSPGSTPGGGVSAAIHPVLQDVEFLGGKQGRRRGRKMRPCHLSLASGGIQAAGEKHLACLLSCPVVCDPCNPVDCSPPGSSVRGIL